MFGDPATRSLTMGGQVIGIAHGSSGHRTVPTEPARCAPPAIATHPTSTVPTKMDAAWTFEFGPAGDGGATVPLMAIRFAPDGDGHNSALGGRQFTIPVSAERLPGAGYGNLRTIQVDVSYDDDTTWQAAPLTGTGWNRTATVSIPPVPASSRCGRTSPTPTATPRRRLSSGPPPSAKGARADPGHWSALSRSGDAR